jgi:predicted PurR-regulated permease PerM
MDIIPKPTGNSISKQVIHIALQLLALAGLIVWCYQIIYPFIAPVVWAAILAIALYPFHNLLKRKLGDRGTLAAVIITVLMLSFLIGPAIWLGVSTAQEVKTISAAYHAGNLNVPPPNENVKSWPLVGEKAYGIWQQASTGIDSLIQKHPTVVKTAVTSGIGLIASTGKGVLFFTLSIIISGVFLTYSASAATFTKALFNRLIGDASFDMTSVAALTIRNVVKGILGVAFIQSTMAAIGFIIVGIPAAGIWVLACLILGIVQIGTFPVAAGTIIYIWSTGSTLTATLFTIWMIIVSLIDNVLKPILLGKGAPVPMLIVFIGAIGGFILSGFVGLFTGAVILSLGYKLFEAWLQGNK